MTEPIWSKNMFASSNVCYWFFILATFNGILGVAGILASVYLVSRGVKTMAFLLTLMLAVTVSFTNAWFLYIVCERGLNA